MRGKSKRLTGPPLGALLGVDPAYHPSAPGALAPLEGAIASLPLALAGGWTEAATSAHALPESFPLLRGHALPALGHAAAGMAAVGTVASESAEEDPGERENSQRLPEGD